VRFQVLTAASMKMAVYRVVAPCSLVEVYRRFRGACCLHHQGDDSSPTQKTAAIFFCTGFEVFRAKKIRIVFCTVKQSLKFFA
jgi:hypothetical protein